ncbi:hypothetical protein N0V82_007058 [Gnomoniopsis sp. IMI 355080]|nr:hypothetical protein N0V82_007058 [Gnomoniopsis sp. IMI 355080]
MDYRPNLHSYYEDPSERLPRVEAVQPYYDFETAEEFALRHRQGTEAEFNFEKWQINRFNESEHKFEAWPIRNLSSGKTCAVWLLLVVPAGGHDSLLPKEGETCNAEVLKEDCGERISRSLASRVDNPCALWGIKDPFWQRCMAFEIVLNCNDSTKSTSSSFVTLTPALTAQSFKKGLTGIPKLQAQKLSVTFELRLSSSTRDAEIGALDILLGRRKRNAPEDKKRVAAFEYFVTLTPTHHSSLFQAFPHMAYPFHDPSQVPWKLMQRFSKFNVQQKFAYKKLLGHIPDGICMVPGGPGAGKTFWNLTVAASLQSKDEIKEPGEVEVTKSRNKVLYLIDMNRPLTDVANKMVQVYKDLDLTRNCCDDCGVLQPRTVIRMFAWSYETGTATKGYIKTQGEELERRGERVRNGQEVKDGQGPLSKYNAETDSTDKTVLDGFAASFFKMTQSATMASKKLSADQDCFAKTLDQAAAEYYARHVDNKYAHLEELVKALENTPSDDLMALRNSVAQQVYNDTLDNADFVATTPVTASKFSHVFFSPTLVIFDEAPHARDLSLLISVALFEPHAWILTGDHRQSKPFVGSFGKDCNKYVNQLRVSVMERAHKKDKNMTSLLINHRASGNLQELASKLFYDSKMLPAKDPDQLGAIPREALYLREKYIMPMKNDEGPQVSRLLVVLKDCGYPEKAQSSWHHEGHRTWVMGLLSALTRDKRFLKANSTERGTILVMSPYKRAFIEYAKDIRDLRKSYQGLDGCTVEARTVDTAQGHEADVCILDFVHFKCTPHLEDASRMCVALTRARQAELIIMHEDMIKSVETYPSRYPMMAHMVRYCKTNGQFVHGPEKVWNCR